jgi:FkbM family methyltransferase
MPEAPLRLPGGGPTLTIDVGVDFADAMRRSGGWYERHLMRLLPILLPPDGVALDIGANAGAIALSMAHLAPRGEVFAFEAAPPNADRLETNVARAGMANVHVERIALYDRRGELALSYLDEHSGGANVSNALEATATRIAAIPLDDWAGANDLSRVDLVKLDVEGSEVRVLRGGRETLARFRPTLIVECNPVTLSGQDRATTGDLLDVLDELGYRLGWIAGRGAVIPVRDRTALGRILGATGIVDLLATTGRPRGRRDPQALLGRLKANHRVQSANRTRRPPRGRYVVAPTLCIDADTAVRTVDPGGRIPITVTVTNTGDGWLSSDFDPHPVLITYRWIAPDGTELGDEPRTRLPRPLRPGESCRLTIDVGLPEEPGDWTVAIRAVQEGFVWLDTFTPEAAKWIPVVVVPPMRC